MMRGFSRTATRAASKVVASFVRLATLCFACRCNEDENTFNGNVRCENKTKSKASLQPSRFSEECNEMALQYASNEIEKMIQEPRLPSPDVTELGSMSLALVPQNFGKKSIYPENWDMQSADENIDISGLEAPLAPPQTFEVRNARRFLRKHETKEKRKRFFRGMRQKFSRTFSK